MGRCIVCQEKIDHYNFVKFVNTADNREMYLCNACDLISRLRLNDYEDEEAIFIFKSSAKNKINRYVNELDKTKTTLYGIEFEFEHKSTYPKFKFYKNRGPYISDRIIEDARKNLILNLILNLRYHKTMNIVKGIVDDGSLDEDSSELVTYPRSFNWLKYNNTLKDMLKIMLEYGYTDNTEAGLHISFNINSVGRRTVYKIMSFLLDNKDKMMNISMRRNFYYAQFKEDTMLSIPSGDKYLALSARSDTRAELRLFKGTLRYDRVMRAIEFIDALINMYRSEYTYTTDFDKFVDYLNAHNKRYDTLLNFLVERNIIENVSV